VSLTVVIGGTRSGKSACAERLARESGLPVSYVATADADDGSMAARIAEHAARRPPEWETVVAGDDLAAALVQGRCVLVDGLGAWIAGIMERDGVDKDGKDCEWDLESSRSSVLERVETFARAAGATGNPVIVVAERAGEGMLPMDALSRAWLDLLGEATQRLANVAERALLVVAGRAIELPSAGVAIAARATGLPAAGGATPDRASELSAAGAATTVTAVAGRVGALRHHGDRDVRPGDADHAVNVVAGGPPHWLRTALDAALHDAADRYPREDDAVAALAELHGREPREIVPTNGAAEALWLLASALRPRLAACVHPAFTESEAALHAHDVAVVRVLRDPEGDFALDPTQVPDAADLVVVGNPASPSGTLDPAAAVLAVRRPGRTVVVDEAFMELVPGQPGSLVRTPLQDVIVVRSLTKVLSIPGLRAGYAVAPPALADRLRAVRPPWSANALALAALRAAAAHPAGLAAIAERAAAERHDLQDRLRAIDGVHVWPGAANFVLIEVADGPALLAALRAERIAVRPAASFPGLDERHIRISAREPALNARVAEAIGAALGVAA
jgi:histidinol-phosphate/aromatic aminotransferase/cobyric acid decarboxylase-like protein/adenosyl cobinamide kinase/adenosyl cobinamide phosphate guanylyltransferase